jgi:hypothetical protein
LRDFIDAILTAIGAESLNDDEFDLITEEEQAYTVGLYTEVLLVLDSREAVSNTRDRLSIFSSPRGVSSPRARPRDLRRSIWGMTYAAEDLKELRRESPGPL